ncbi:MAG TPA: recombination protein O N-terminal domain-containing protein [Candidatus Paceibacterota bacterium]|nr:recombination protein O N-terminal domain-containing protein [Candidatus Paceibacterota bacterium]
MRHKYETRGLVLARTHGGEANTFVALLTSDLGLVHARAQSLRKTGAKLAAALATLAESEIVLVRGKEGWRVTGAVLDESWFAQLERAAARGRVARVSGLLLRLVAGETQDAEIFPIMRGFLEALATVPDDLLEAVEILAVLRVLAALGLDTGDIPGTAADFAPTLLTTVVEDRKTYVARINTGIAASGL